MRRLSLLLLSAILLFGSGAFSSIAGQDYKSNIPQILADDSLPSGVRKSFASIVAVLVYRPNALSGSLDLSAILSGFAVGDRRVLTCFHGTALGQPSSFYYLDAANTKILVAYYDGVKQKSLAYQANITAVSPQKDLALLEVLDNDDSKFDLKPLFVSPLDVGYLVKNSKAGWFCFKYAAEDVVFWKELRNFSGYFTNPNLSSSPDVRGMFGETLEAGYSGSPVLYGDGRCFGIIVAATPSTIFFIPGWKINEFLRESAKAGKK